MSRKTRGQVHGHTYEAHIRPKRLAEDANRIAQRLIRDREKPALEAPVKIKGETP